MLEWQTLISIIAVLISGLTFLFNRSEKSITFREFEEFRISTDRYLDDLKYSVRTLEQTRPTTGELEARFKRNGMKD